MSPRAEEVPASVDPYPDPAADAELLAELDRRASELRADPAAGMPWDAVKDLR